MKILLVENDTAIARALTTFLTEKGCRVTVSPTLLGARDQLATTLPDVAVLDWNLPDGAGADLCRELRQRWPRLPLLLLTVRDDTRDILAGFACGADDYVTKPFDREVLYARLLALGLATSVISTVFNQLGAMLGGGVVGAIFFAVVFLIGHSMNMAINLLGAYVHTNRLQFVEFFGKFYEGGGRKFQPFAANTKHFKIMEEK